MYNEIDEMVRADLDAALCEIDVKGIWQPAFTTIRKCFLNNLVGILCASKGFEGIVALSIPNGVANKISEAYSKKYTERSPIQLFDKIFSKVLLRLKSKHLIFTNKGIINGIDPRYPAPIPRRIIEYKSENGNLAIEIYLHRISIFESGRNEWWNAGIDRIGELI